MPFQEAFPGFDILTFFPRTPVPAKESPAPASDQEPEGIPGAVIVGSINGYIVAEQHGYQVEGSNKAMQQSPRNP